MWLTSIIIKRHYANNLSQKEGENKKKKKNKDIKRKIKKIYVTDFCTQVL